MKKISTNRRFSKCLFTLLFTFFIVSGSTAQTQWAPKGATINGEADSDNSGTCLSINADGSIVAIGARGNDPDGLDIAGHVRVYHYSDGAWVQLGEDIDGEDSGEESGVAVSLTADGMTVAIGAYSSSSSAPYAGKVRVFHFNGTGWVQVGNDINGEANGDRSGYSVSISSDGQIVAIGAPYNDNYRGHVRVFAFTGGEWVQLGADIDGENQSDLFGNAVSLSSDGSILAVGAMWNDGNGLDSGHVRVFHFTGSDWVQIGADIDGATEIEDSGYSVSLNAEGTIVAIGANASSAGGTFSGQVRVFENSSENWIQKGQDLNGDQNYCQFGNSVSLSSDGLALAVGSSYYKGALLDAGQVKTFRFADDLWVQTGSSIEGEGEMDLAGYWVCLNSDATVLAFGAPSNSGGGLQRGSVRVFSSYTLNSGIGVHTEAISVYPNPASDKLIIELSANNRKVNFEIFNSLGQVVHTGNLTGKTLIQTSGFPQGVYLIKLESGKTREFRKVIIE